MRVGCDAFHLSPRHKLRMESCDFDLTAIPISFGCRVHASCVLSIGKTGRQKLMPRRTDITKKG